MLWSAQSVVQSGALLDRLPILRYVVVSTASGAVGSIVGQIANIQVCCGQYSQWYSRGHCGTDCQNKGMLWSVQPVVQSGALWDRLPILRYVVVSRVSGAVGSIV